jgi:N-acetylmuramoyl-L-alanine amidase
MLKKLTVFLVLALLPYASNSASFVKSFRASDTADSSRFVLELSERPAYKIFTLENPTRVVIDIADTSWDDALRPHNETKRIKGVRYSVNPNGGLRVVLDANQPVKLKKDFVLSPSEDLPYRLVIDITDPNAENIGKGIPQPVIKHEAAVKIPVPILKERKKPLIIIDAGHGGHDPGTIGYKGTEEKSVTLLYAKELGEELLATGRYNIVLTRERDIFIKLGDRVDIARRSGGDLFISIHANSHPNRDTEGFSIYTLSENASDKEAAALATKENKADIITGIDLKEKEDDLAEVFIDMTQRDTKNLSASFAETIVEATAREAKQLQNPHRFAGFKVLTGADIPSVLIELGYLSNRKEEKLIISEIYKKKLAKSFVEAIDIHFKNYQIE